MSSDTDRMGNRQGREEGISLVMSAILPYSTFIFLSQFSNATATTQHVMRVNRHKTLCSPGERAQRRPLLEDTRVHLKLLCIVYCCTLWNMSVTPELNAVYT